VLKSKTFKGVNKIELFCGSLVKKWTHSDGCASAVPRASQNEAGKS
jgi:hypothetical protein